MSLYSNVAQERWCGDFYRLMNQNFSFTGGYLENEYTLAQFHCHWGDEFRGGSEHTLNGQRYFAEVHLVHYKTEYGGLNDDSLGNGDGLAVLGYFIDAG